MSILTDTYTLNTGTRIPRVGFGTWQIPDGEPAYRAVRTALDAGYRHVDTAYDYGNEASVGRAIRDSGLPREQVFVTSKLPADAKTYEDARARLEESVSKLDVGYLDLYLVHAPWPWDRIGQPYDQGNLEAWRALEEALDDGRLRAIGVSNFAVRDMRNLLEHARVAPAVNQIQYYVGFTEPRITAFAREHGMVVEAYSPLATGDILNNPAIVRIADAHGVGVAHVALRFCLDQGVVPLPKARSAEHIRANAQLDFELSASELAALRAMPDAAPRHYHNPTQG